MWGSGEDGGKGYPILFNAESCPHLELSLRLKIETGFEPGKVVGFGEGIGKGSGVGAAASDLGQNNAVNSPKNYKKFQSRQLPVEKKGKEGKK